MSLQHSRSEGYASRIYEAFLAGDMTEWISVMEDMEHSDKADTAHWLELTGYYYGWVGYLINSGQSAQAKEYIKRGEAIIDRILSTEPENAQALSFKGTFIVFRLSLAKLKAVVLGPQSMKYINKGYAINPQQYQIMADKANLLYYAPPVFGGNKEEALHLYHESIRTMEKEGREYPNWFYLSLQNSLAEMYEKRGETEIARQLYIKLLDKEPRYLQVREKLDAITEK
ncbi:MAG: hypothetical protein LUE98_21080 [Tannerellaceae bacterium]|nr:hypothetical protein [Tannerellaceae bacterium]